ncbi:MAG: DUF4143 domain-containing protein [Bacteroidales bacterium]|nr:DUF4143 domain-containing protein [Bacteroidales bacterium]MCM1422976.1 DUF4143 domain-containing protein [bacterium]
MKVHLLTGEYRPRIIDKKINDYMKSFGAVCVEGPKWCGKTWASLHQARSVSYLADPANGFQNRRMAEISPELVLAGECPRVIDEWQEVPEIWDAVRFAVDQEEQKGRYLLTGSSTPKTKGILHSGAGRIGRLRMSTMSLYEMGESSGEVGLTDLFQDSVKPVATGDVNLERLIQYTVRGGWPGSRKLADSDASRIPVQYLQAVVESDMYRLDGVKRDSEKVYALLHSLGRNESTIASNQTLKKDITAYEDEVVEKDTIVEYLDAFDRLFLIDNQPAFHPALRSSRRALKSPKRHFSDPSLAVAALSASPEMLLRDLNTFGFLFEALCEHDLKIYAESNEGSLYHFRDDRGNEIDAVVELPDGRWGAFEIKLGANQIEAAAKELLKMHAIMEKEATAPSVLCVICGMSNMAYKRQDGVFVVPITALRD